MLSLLLLKGLLVGPCRYACTTATSFASHLPDLLLFAALPGQLLLLLLLPPLHTLPTLLLLLVLLPVPLTWLPAHTSANTSAALRIAA
jgi:hypothetical protein